MMQGVQRMLCVLLQIWILQKYKKKKKDIQQQRCNQTMPGEAKRVFAPVRTGGASRRIPRVPINCQCNTFAQLHVIKMIMKLCKQKHTTADNKVLFYTGSWSFILRPTQAKLKQHASPLLCQEAPPWKPRGWLLEKCLVQAQNGIRCWQTAQNKNSPVMGVFSG